MKIALLKTPRYFGIRTKCHPIIGSSPLICSPVTHLEGSSNAGCLRYKDIQVMNCSKLIFTSFYSFYIYNQSIIYNNCWLETLQTRGWCLPPAPGVRWPHLRFRQKTNAPTCYRSADQLDTASLCISMTSQTRGCYWLRLKATAMLDLPAAQAMMRGSVHTQAMVK